MARVIKEQKKCSFITKLLNSMVTPKGFVCFLAFVTVVFVFYSIQPATRKLLMMINSIQPGASKLLTWVQSPTRPTWDPAPSPPEWATPEESALFAKRILRWQVTEGMCNGCNAYHYKRVINPQASICSPMKDEKNPDLLILVATTHNHTRYRALIRKTWGTDTQGNTGRARLVFLLGLDPGRNLTAEKLLSEEAAAYGDILQDNFNSTYRRGGEVQLIMGYRWAVEQCSNIMHILKVSDDTFVSIPKILDLTNKPELAGVIWGECYEYSKPNREKKHRRFVSFEDWPSDLYPKYCAGAYLGITMPVLRKILLVSPYIAWFSGNDDVLVGMCAEKIGVQTKWLPGFRVWDGTNPCYITDPKYAIHFHGVSPEVIGYFWERRDCFEGGRVHRGSKDDPKIYPEYPGLRVRRH